MQPIHSSRTLFRELSVFSNLSYLSTSKFEKAIPFTNLKVDRIEYIDRDNVQVYIVENADSVIVIFRGTDYTEDESENPPWSWQDIKRSIDAGLVEFPYGPGKVHAGYLKGIEIVKGDIIRILKTMSSDKTLIFTGHSLGGALAALGCIIIKPAPAYTVTFGSPKIGNSKFIKNHDHVKLVRIVNGSDIVPKYPVGWFKYKQHVQYYHLNRGGDLKMKKWGFWGNLILPGVITKGLFDHRIGDYSDKLGGVQL